MKKFLTIILVFIVSFSFAACQKEGHVDYISAVEAKQLMDTATEDYIILDARTQEEYDESHIPGAILIPYDEVKEKAKDMLPDKDQLIFVYCRTGRRSKHAAARLFELGYTNVKEFGGILSWEYDLVTGIDNQNAS